MSLRGGTTKQSRSCGCKWIEIAFPQFWRDKKYPAMTLIVLTLLKKQLIRQLTKLPFRHHLDKYIARNIHITHRFHFFLSFFLFLKKFTFTRDISSITLSDDILTLCRDRLTSDNLWSYRCLNRYSEEMLRYQIFQSLTDIRTDGISFRFVNNKTKRLHYFTIDHHIQRDHVS